MGELASNTMYNWRIEDGYGLRWKVKIVTIDREFWCWISVRKSEGQKSSEK